MTVTEKVTEKVTEEFTNGRLSFKTENEILKILGLAPSQKGALRTILKKLTAAGIIVKIPSGG